jgi:hypothetical protein
LWITISGIDGNDLSKNKKKNLKKNKRPTRMSPRQMEISPSVRGKIATLRGFVQRLAPSGSELSFLSAILLDTLSLASKAWLYRGRSRSRGRRRSRRGAAKAR